MTQLSWGTDIKETPALLLWHSRPESSLGWNLLKLELLHGTSDKGNVNATKHFSSFMNITHFAERQPGNCEVPTLYKLKGYSFFVCVGFVSTQTSQLPAVSSENCLLESIKCWIFLNASNLQNQFDYVSTPWWGSVFSSTDLSICFWVFVTF